MNDIGLVLFVIAVVGVGAITWVRFASRFDDPPPRPYRDDT